MQTLVKFNPRGFLHWREKIELVNITFAFKKIRQNLEGKIYAEKIMQATALSRPGKVHT